jgi:hypothetical protein
MGEQIKLHEMGLRFICTLGHVEEIRWVGHVARIGRRLTRVSYWCESQTGRVH